MKTLVKIILIINGALLLLGGILLGLGLLLGGKTSFGFDWKNSNFQEAKYVDKEIDLDDFDEMEINLSSLELIIEESDKSMVEYHVHEGTEPEIKVENNKLYITQPENNISIQFGYWEEEYVHVYATKEQLAEINLSSGSIKIDDINVTGDVSTTSGSIAINNSNGKNLNVKANSGSIKLNNMEYDSLTTDQTSGESKLTNIKSKTLDSKSNSGSRMLENVEAEEVSLSVTSGETKINNVKADKINVTGGSGSIKAEDCTIGDFKAEATSGSVKVINSALNNADIKITSGEIRLELKGNEADYGYDLDKNSGSIKINGTHYDDDLQKSGNTDNLLKIKTTSGSITIDIN